ncbi:MAG TPA: ATP-binding protein, partial [Verrucomicrobiae bacterium]|nr:ATP-binding protein [Verrucomicrobiae bacterium]
AEEHLAKGKREGVADFLVKLNEDLQDLLPLCTDESLKKSISDLANKALELESQERGDQKKDRKGCWHNEFSEAKLRPIFEGLESLARQADLPLEDTISIDSPRPFLVSELPDCVEALSADVSGRDAQFVDSLKLRIRGLLFEPQLTALLDPENTAGITLDKWLNDYIGESEAANGPLAVLDLSLVPSEVIHIMIAVLARMVFEAVQRYRRLRGTALPTVLVLEEAHTFVHRDLRSDSAPAPGRLCCRVFERIAREGRKFGLGLVLASQRPSEMSETVLAQCNTFLLHRLVNDRDQELVRKLVPEGHGDLLRELPSLPSRRAILLGWGAPAPVLVEVRELPKEQRPHSPDPRFWDVWTGEQPCDVDWSKIASNWQGIQTTAAQASDQQDAGREAAGG